MLIVTGEGDGRCKLRTSGRAMVALVFLRKHYSLAEIAASTSGLHTAARITRGERRISAAWRDSQRGWTYAASAPRP